MAKRRRKRKSLGSTGNCAGRTSKGRIKKGYRLKKGSCPVKVR
jgi:hypothetical protein